jgi:hypothetical protein
MVIFTIFAQHENSDTFCELLFIRLGKCFSQGFSFSLSQDGYSRDFSINKKYAIYV